MVEDRVVLNTLQYTGWAPIARNQLGHYDNSGKPEKCSRARFALLLSCDISVIWMECPDFQGVSPMWLVSISPKLRSWNWSAFCSVLSSVSLNMGNLVPSSRVARTLRTLLEHSFFLSDALLTSLRQHSLLGFFTLYLVWASPGLCCSLEIAF